MITFLGHATSVHSAAITVTFEEAAGAALRCYVHFLSVNLEVSEGYDSLFTLFPSLL